MIRTLFALRMRPEASRERQHPTFDLFENSLIRGGVCAIGILDRPLFYFSAAGRTVNRNARKIHNEIGGVDVLRGESPGGEAFDGVAVGDKGVDGGFDDITERSEPGAGWFEDVGGVMSGNGLGHRATAGVANTNKDDAELFARGHLEIVTRKPPSKEPEGNEEG